MRQLLDIRPIPININYNYPLGQYDMHSPPAELNIDIKKSELDVEPHKVRLQIDHTATKESLGLYAPVSFSKKTAAEAKQDVYQAIARIGDDARSITESHGRSAPDIHRKNMGTWSVDMDNAYIPVAPTSNWSGGGITEPKQTDTSFSPFRMDINWRVNLTPEMTYNRGQFNLNVVQWHKVEIAYLGTYDDITVIGNNVNKKM